MRRSRKASGVYSSFTAMKDLCEHLAHDDLEMLCGIEVISLQYTASPALQQLVPGWPVCRC